MAAAVLFVELGFSGTTMQNIADSAGLSVGYIYKHFPGKKELLDEIIFAQLDRVEREREETVSTHEDDPLMAIQVDLVRRCEQIAEVGHLVSLFIVYEKNNLEEIKPRFDRIRFQLELMYTRAMEKGQLKKMDAALLAAAADGVVWGLIKAMNDNNSLHRVGEVPALVADLIIKPLMIEDTKQGERT